jgi:hypothetical protein
LGTPSENAVMWDLLFLAATAVLFWLAVVYTRRCDRI